MTEDEASKVWCPKAMVNVNRQPTGDWDTDTSCIGSRCGVWVKDIIWEGDPPQGHCGLIKK